MSLAAMTWAFALDIKPASLKFLLVSCADSANFDGEFWPSLRHLCSKTSMDRKTIINGIDHLEKLGLLLDTKKRTGRTSQVKVYKLIGFNNNSGNGTVPVFPRKSTVFPKKEYRFSQETVPKTEHGIYVDPNKEPVMESHTAFQAFEKIKTEYPAGLYREAHWIEAEREFYRLLDDHPSEQLLQAVKDYAAQQKAAGKLGTTFILSPQNFFRTGAWLGPFPLPKRPAKPVYETEDLSKWVPKEYRDDAN